MVPALIAVHIVFGEIRAKAAASLTSHSPPSNVGIPIWFIIVVLTLRLDLQKAM